jgi:hypothetical protein
MARARAQHKDAMDKIRVREFHGRGRPQDIEGRETDALGLQRGRVVDEIAKKLARERGKPAKRMADLRLPAARNVRPQTIDGRTSFHFSHEAVSKTRNNMEKDSGLRIGPGAARKHGKYIERDGAVAAMSDKEKAELEKLLDGHPELEAGESPDGLLTIERRKEAALHGYYVERQEALATQPDGEKVLFTNISADPLERARVWDKIEEFERNPSPDELTIHVARHQAFWDRVRQDPDLPRPLADALLLAEADKPYRFQTDDARSSLRWLREQPDWDREDPAVKARLGEGGRIQYRMIGELPHELDLRSRTAVLAEFAHEFERRKLPYVAVMHAPDHANDDRNWHFHLIYYDRPIERMADGRWDFEVQVEKTDKWRNRWNDFPHRQEKVKEVNEKTWIPKMRKRLAEITNDHMQMAGLPRRVDPRRYSEMGIHREAQEHLGTRAASLESMGVATPVGYRNANKEWDAVFADVERRREGEQKKTDTAAQRYHARVDRNFRSDPNENATLHARVERWRQSRDEAAEFTSLAISVQKNYERLISRAEKVNRACDKQIEAARSTRLANNKKAETVRLSRRQAEALMEIREAKAFMGPMLDAAQGWAKSAELLRAQAGREEREIERLLARSDGETDDRLKEVRRRRQMEEGTFQGQDGDYRRALNKAEMDAWVESILKDRRRLVRKDRRVEPMTTRPGDEKYLEAGNYGVMTARLAKIKESQDRLVAEVVAYVGKNPHSVQRERDEQGDVVLSLRVSRPQWKSAFSDYAEDPDMRKAALDALAVRDAARGGRAAGSQRAPEPVGAPVPQDGGPRRDETAPAPDVGRAGGIDGMLTRISREAVRLRLDGGAVRADPRALAGIGVTAQDLEPEFVQERLRGILRQQEREFARLASFVEKHPYAIVEKDGRYQLGPKSPRDLAAIAEKWIGDDETQATLRATRETLRAPARSRQEKPVETARPVATSDRADERRPAPPAPAEEVPGRTPAAPATERREPSVRTPDQPGTGPTTEAVPPRAPAQAAGPERARPAASPEEPGRGGETPREPARPPEAPRPEKTPEPAQASLFDQEAPDGPATGQAVFGRPRPAVDAMRRTNEAMDAWLRAGEQERTLADRRRLAADLAKDRQALAELAAADPELARQLQVDADAFRRAQSLGAKRGRGRAPRR